MRILGAVLAGGQATRFGSDKAMALLHGRPLILHAAASIAPVVNETIVCGRDGAPLGLESVADWPVAGLGPLGGICGALRHAADRGFDIVLTIGCDTPAVPPDLIALLLAADRAAFVRQLPIIGSWPPILFANLERHLAGGGGDRSVRRWAAAIGAAPLDAGHDLANVNSADDLRNCANAVDPIRRHSDLDQ